MTKITERTFYLKSRFILLVILAVTTIVLCGCLGEKSKQLQFLEKEKQVVNKVGEIIDYIKLIWTSLEEDNFAKASANLIVAKKELEKANELLGQLRTLVYDEKSKQRIETYDNLLNYLHDEIFHLEQAIIAKELGNSEEVRYHLMKAYQASQKRQLILNQLIGELEG